MNQEPQTPLEQYDSLIKETFTPEKLQAIFAVINHLRAPYGEWLKDNEFDTIVHVAGVQAIDKLIKDMVQFTLRNTTLPNNLTQHGKTN